MTSTKKILLLASFLLVIGIIGIAITFPYGNKEGTQETETVNIEEMDFNQLKVSADNATVNILSSNEESPRVEYTSSKDNYDFNVETKESTLNINAEEKRLDFFNIDFLLFETPSIHVYLPDKALENLQTKTDNGKITASNIEATKIYLSTDNGKINAEQIASDLHAETSNGKITLNQVAGEVNVTTNNGKIEIQQATNNIVAKTDNGSITISNENLNNPMDLQTSNGKIIVNTGTELTNATLDLRTDNGSITVFGTKDWDTVYGSGENLIKMRTNNGSITIE
ncbi:DUF4097 family beta strand repeat-containing protein [Oceanobacillus sp. 1P07AA]|uniref:DUF4097 family beta strand repeat-containing protein n=1 Tax=Oceanobacillus sp. 1P07AA TaxID=3132293 RepID=UPI0039A6854D